MPPRPASQPLAFGISHPELSAYASNRRPALLPLGAMMAAAVALSGAAHAQQATQATPAEAAALPAIHVNTQREENTGYQGIRTTMGKTPQLLRDVPQGPGSAQTCPPRYSCPNHWNTTVASW